MDDPDFYRWLTPEEETEYYDFINQLRRYTMTPEVIVAIANFMNRCTLKPEEIAAYQTCIQALDAAHREATNPPAPEATFEPEFTEEGVTKP